MTNESRRAFEEYYKARYDNIESEFSANLLHTWQASKSCEQARILALLDSSEFLEFMVEKLIYKTSAQDLIEAIKQRIKG